MPRVKSFVPLESDPSIFTSLLHKLGASETLQFIDIWSLDDPDQLAIIPRPVLGFILVLFTPEEAQQQKQEEGVLRPNYAESPDRDAVVWFKQTIYNACGLYAMLHAVCNTQREGDMKPNSILSNLLTSARKSPAESTHFLESSQELSEIYHTFALQGSTSAPGAEDVVDYHYICFSKGKDGLSIYELDGDLKGPMRAGLLESEDDDEAFLAAGIEAVKAYVRERSDENFSLMALVDAGAHEGL